jgi:hypothetical protein
MSNKYWFGAGPISAASGAVNADYVLVKCARRDRRRDAGSRGGRSGAARQALFPPVTSFIPGRCEASNPESRDSPMRNCASEVWYLRTIRND